jgi:hypothetical protein
MRDAISYPRPNASGEPRADRVGGSHGGRPSRDAHRGAEHDRLTDRPTGRPVLGETRRARIARLLADLQTTVVSFVHARRAAGVPVERVLPEVVCLVRESESCEGWRDSSERLMAQVVRWSIDAYHDAAQRPAP